MTGLYIENRNPKSLTPDLARHLYVRSHSGRVAIIAERPQVFLSALKKQWLKVECQVSHERSATLNPARLQELGHELSRMRNMRFSIKVPTGTDEPNVQMGTITQLLEWAPSCRTMYITCPVTREQLHLVAAWMPDNSLLVFYGNEPGGSVAKAVSLPFTPDRATIHGV